MKMLLSRSFFCLMLLTALLPGISQAQLDVGNYGRVPDTGMSASRQVPQDKILSNVRWEQKLQSQLPLDVPFKDEDGKDVKFGKYFESGRPVVLAMIFYDCTMLCSQVLNGMLTSIKEVKLAPGKDYDLVVISINPKEGPKLAKEKKGSYLAEYGLSQYAAGVHFLTGQNPDIKKVASAAGYFYEYDKKTDQYAHPGGFLVITPQGKVARYHTGVMFEPRDVRWSLVEASQGKVGSIGDLILLRCFHYNDTTGKYTLAIMEVLRIVAAGFVMVVGTSLALWIRKDLKKQKALSGEAPVTVPSVPGGAG